jgi:hypothetical protein
MSAAAPRPPQPSAGRVDVRAEKQVNKGALSYADAALWLDVSVDTLEAHVLPSIRVVAIGQRKVIAVTELQAWLDRNSAVWGSVA